MRSIQIQGLGKPPQKSFNVKKVRYRGITVSNGSGSMFAVAYTASAVAQKTSVVCAFYFSTRYFFLLSIIKFLVRFFFSKFTLLRKPVRMGFTSSMVGG